MTTRQLVGAMALLTALTSCESAETGPLLSVSAPRPWLGATVELDGVEVAQLSELMSNTGLAGALFSRLYPESPLQDLVAVNLPLASWRTEAGLHEVVVRAESGSRQSLEFRYPFRDGAEHCLVFVDESDVVVGDECVAEEPAG